MKLTASYDPIHLFGTFIRASTYMLELSILYRLQPW